MVYKIVTRSSLMLCHRIACLSLAFSWYTHSPKGWCVDTEKITSYSWIFHGIQFESFAELFFFCMFLYSALNAVELVFSSVWLSVPTLTGKLQRTRTATRTADQTTEDIAKLNLVRQQLQQAMVTNFRARHEQDRPRHQLRQLPKKYRAGMKEVGVR